MDARSRTLLKLLLEQKNNTAERLALSLHTSEKTVRKILKFLRVQLEQEGASLISRPKVGYELEIRDSQRFREFLDRLEESDPPEAGDESGQRIIQILHIFLSNLDRYVKMEELEDRLYLSRSSLNRELKVVRQLLAKRNLVFESKPNYGMRIVGDEYDIRICIADYITKQELSLATAGEYDTLLATVLEVLEQVRREEKLNLTNFGFENLVSHLYVALTRIRQNKEIVLESQQLEGLRQRPEYQAACRIGQLLEERLDLTIPQSELGYMTIHLAAKGTMPLPAQADSYEISEEINALVGEILNQIYQRYCLDLRSDFDLIMALSLHLVSLDVRLRYELNLENPILQDILQRFQLAFLITQSCVNEVIQRHYGRELSDDEIAYLALHINLALERMKNGPEKKRLLIICATGAGTSQLLKYEYGRRFRNYVSSIQVADPGTVTSRDLEEADYILTTIPLRLPCSKPVLQVHPLIDASDLNKVGSTLEQESRVLGFFSPQLFFPHLSGDTPGQVIREMLPAIAAVHPLPGEFLRLVEEREQLGYTSFQSMVAFPHPNRPCVDRTFVAVGILDHPILWHGNRVQMVYLMALTREKQSREPLPILYQVTGQLLTDTERIRDIVKKRSYQCLTGHLTEIEKSLGV